MANTNPLRADAHHEAGHAVAAVVHGVGLASVDIRLQRAPTGRALDEAYLVLAPLVTAYLVFPSLRVERIPIYEDGLFLGAITAYVTGSYIETQLFGVNAGDVPVFAISIGILLTAALAASFLPAWRVRRARGRASAPG